MLRRKLRVTMRPADVDPQKRRMASDNTVLIPIARTAEMGSRLSGGDSPLCAKSPIRTPVSTRIPTLEVLAVRTVSFRA